MRVIAVYNLKGGVGKSTTAANLACLAARGGERTLLLDLDPQGAAGYFLGHGAGKGGGRKLIENATGLSALVESTKVDNLDIVPARFSFRRFDERLRGNKKPKETLHRILAGLSGQYDWVFLDTPAGLTLLSENVFAAVDCLLVPLIPTPLSLRAWERIVVFLSDRGYDLARLIPFFSMAQGRRRVHRDTMELFRQREPGVCRAVIPSLSSIETAAATRTIVALRRPHSLAGEAFAALWAEVRGRLAGGPPVAAPPPAQ